MSAAFDAAAFDAAAFETGDAAVYGTGPGPIGSASAAVRVAGGAALAFLPTGTAAAVKGPRGTARPLVPTAATASAPRPSKG